MQWEMSQMTPTDMKLGLREQKQLNVRQAEKE